jgi:hypothetical protein
VIALGLAVEFTAVGLLIVGLLLGEARAPTPLWSAIVMALLGLAVTAAGVQRARPPRRSLTPLRSSAAAVTGRDPPD